MKEIEGFEKGFSPSRSTGSGDNNENDIPKFQNHKKIVAKHFMSPTISAASKAAAPRKKILAERNENLSTFDAKHQKMPNPEMRKSPRNSSISYSSGSLCTIVSSNNRVSDDEWDTNVMDKSVKDYDPSTNYLSPRPKYLRFNPNRRREIFDRLEKEGREELISPLVSEEFNDEGGSVEEDTKDSSFSAESESVVMERNEENTEEDDDYEEEDEEELEEQRGWCLRGVLKLLFTLIACFLSTSYICSMNSPTPSSTQQAIWSLRDGYLMVKEQALEVINMRMYDADFLEIEAGDSFGEVEEVEICEDDNGGAEESVEAEVETGDSFGEVEEVEIDEDDNGEMEESVEAEVVEDNDEYSGGCDNVVGNEKEDSEDKIDDEVADIEVVRGSELELKAYNFEQLVAVKREESDSSCVEEVESSYPVSNEDDVAKTDESEDSGGCGSEELEGSDQLQELELLVKPISKETTTQELEGVDQTESLELIVLHEKLTNSGDQVDETGYNNQVVIAVSVATVILTSLAIVYLSKRARNISAKKSEPQKSAVEEEKIVTPVLPPVKRKIEFFARPLVSHAMEEASREFSHHIQAPNIELIGEIVVGQMSNRKYKMTASEEKKATFSTPIQPSQLEYSSTNSSSYGSFAAETKILRKEGCQSGETMVEVTPVRRSSRLRNRAAAMSP